MPSRYRISADTGGTFTDFVHFDETTGRLEIAKVPSTPGDPSEAVAAGVAELLDRGAAAADVAFFSHGTTVATNALLEGKGARTGLLVTEGFRGIYEVQEQMRGYGAGVFDFFFQKPGMLAAPRDTLEVPERVGARGEVVKALSEAAARELALKARELEVDSLAICLLFAFRNPTHERRLRDVLAEVAPDLPVSISSDVLPQIREYYRLSTTVNNAYIRPVLGRYLNRLDQRFRELEVRTPQRYVMQSNGGVTTLPHAAERAVTTILSGPAGGVIAGRAIGRAAGRPNLITFDMGGTSCDVALIRDGEPGVTSLTKVAGRDVAVPMLDIHTVSAGGGTIARVERLGDLARLKVGPDSAGARPGPVAYGHGGTEPTVTDANVALGFLAPEARLGGRLTLDREAARTVVEERLARPLGLGLEQAAEGVLRVVDVQMQEAIKAISTRRGYDLRDFTLVAFGGAGPLHATRLARELGISEVLVPAYPGVTSALGLLMADVRHDYVISRLEPLATLDLSAASATFAELELRAQAELGDEGFEREGIELRRQVDLRYAGQGYELTIDATAGDWRTEALDELRTRFDDEHERQFGHSARTSAVEVVNYRVTGLGRVPPFELPRCAEARGGVESAQIAERTIFFSEAGGDLRCKVYARDKLGSGHRFSGPAIVEQLDTTTLVLPGQVVVVDEWGNLLIGTADNGRPATDTATPTTVDGGPSLVIAEAADDPVLQEVAAATLSGIVAEMQNALFRTGYSTVIRETQDASCALLDLHGRLVAQHVVLPLHMGSLPSCLAAVLRHYPLDCMREGDAYVTNHPYEAGVPHAPDMAVITPIFFDDSVVGFAGSMAHKSDIGGPVPGSCSGQARETYNEGLHLPPVRYYAAGEHCSEIDRIIDTNSRTPELVLGDLHGQVGACRLGERRVQEALRKYGREALLGTFERLYARTEARVRLAIAGWADGEAEAERFVDDDGIDIGKPVRIHVRVRKSGDRIHFDFTQSNDQTKGPANVRPPLVRAACAFCLVTLVDRNLAINDGLTRIVEMETRPGSAVDPYFPAPVNTYNPTMHALADAVFEALSHLVPDRKTADGSASRSIFIGGNGPDGRRFLVYELFGGGSGGRLGLDGVSGTTVNHTNGKIAPIEIVESEYPVRVLCFELIRDSGGAGEYRGGLGFAREYELLTDEARFSLRSAKHLIPPRGIDQADDGRGGHCLAYVGTSEERELPTRYGDLPLRRGDRVRLETPGGGGYGNPRDRDPGRVLADVFSGYVSPEAAEERYRVVLRGSRGGLEIDEPKTAELRSSGPP